MMAQFVLDENSWESEGIAPLAYVERIEEILDTVDDLIASGHACVYSDDLFTSALAGDRTFYDLYHPDAPIAIPPDLQERVAAIFGRLRVWQDLDVPWPESFEVSVNGRAEEFAPSIAWAHARASQGARTAVPCIVHGESRPSGHIPVRVGGSVVDVWMIASIEDAPAYFRWLIVETTNSPHEMGRLASDAFPALDFTTDAFDGVKDMSKPYRGLVDDLVKHLGALSDHGQRIFSGPWQRAPADFGALGVELSDENGTTKGNAKARRERTREHLGATRVFWWHTKLEPDRDRIHFDPEPVTRGRALVIGILCRHLTV
jgi:hypothetical protein